MVYKLYGFTPEEIAIVEGLEKSRRGKGVQYCKNCVIIVTF